MKLAQELIGLRTKRVKEEGPKSFLTPNPLYEVKECHEYAHPEEYAKWKKYN